VDVFSTGWRQEGHLVMETAPITPYEMYFLCTPVSLHHPLSSLRRTWWDGVKEDV